MIDTATNAVTASISFGSGGQGVAVTPDGGTVYVPAGANTVVAIDTATYAVIATIGVGNNPEAIGVFIQPQYQVGPTLNLTPGQSLTLSNTSFKSNVTLAAGSTLLLNNVQAQGNVKMNGGSVTLNGGSISGNLQGSGNLNLSGATIGGNVQLQNGAGVFAIGGSNINGNLTVQNLSATSTQSSVCGVTQGGNFVLQNSAGPVEIGGSGCAGNSVSGNLTIQNNSALIGVEGNQVAGNLIAQSNTGAFRSCRIRLPRTCSAPATAQLQEAATVPKPSRASAAGSSRLDRRGLFSAWRGNSVALRKTH